MAGSRRDWIRQRAYTFILLLMGVAALALGAYVIFVDKQAPYSWRSFAHWIGETAFYLNFAMIPVNLWSTHRLTKAMRRKTPTNYMPVSFLGSIRSSDQGMIHSIWISRMVLIFLIGSCCFGIWTRMNGYVIEY